MSRNPYKRAVARPGACTRCTEDDLIRGALTLSEQISTLRHGGLPPQVRKLSDSCYDEDDVQAVDPSTDFGMDRFEKAEAISNVISDRMAKKHKERFVHADV